MYKKESHLTLLRCAPCQAIAAKYDEFSRRHEAAKFLKVDVDQCKVSYTDLITNCIFVALHNIMPLALGLILLKKIIGYY